MQRYYDGYSRRARKSGFASGRAILASKLLKYFFFALIAGIIVFFLYFLWISRSLPTPGKLSNPDVKESTKILASDGQVLYSFYKDVNRLYIPLKDVPEYLQKGTISAEDQDFYQNQGFSIRGYLRVAKDVLTGKRLTGGSTITQQLVKNILLTSERSPVRKINEFILAVQVDQKYTKDQILELYLNNVPYGGTSIGVEAAANMYFNKHAKDLDLAESAFLAGLPQLPTYYSPFSGPNKSYVPRTKYVLSRMHEDGVISQKQADAALKEIEGYKFTQRQGNIKAPHFVMYVRDELVKMFGEALVNNGNLTVKTTLNYNIQKISEDTVRTQIEKLKSLKVGNGAAIVLNSKNGAILSMVGSHDYFDIKGEGNFNASISPRQPGSSLKPITYSTAFEKGYTPSTLIMDTKTDFPTNVPGQKDYSPVNYDGKFRGPVQLRFALGNSLNVPAVKMLSRVGIKNVMQKAYDMGIEDWNPIPDTLKNVGLSLVLGGREATLLQITSAYSVFADQGKYNKPYAITEVKDARGKVIYKHKSGSSKQVLSPNVAFLISHILLDDNARKDAFGAFSLLNIAGKTVSVKTGTTDLKRDNWAIGYTPTYVVGVWVGNNNNEPMNPRIASGITGATPIWHDIMSQVLKGKPSEQFKVPDGVVAVQIDSFGGGLPVAGQSQRTEYFVKGTEPTAPSPIYKKIKVSKQDNGKLANADEISRGDYDLKDFIVFLESDPVSTDGKNRWQDGITTWINDHFKDDQKYHPPTETSDRKYDSNENSNSENSSSPTPTETPAVSPTDFPSPTI